MRKYRASQFIISFFLLICLTFVAQADEQPPNDGVPRFAWRVYNTTDEQVSGFVKVFPEVEPDQNDENTIPTVFYLEALMPKDATAFKYTMRAGNLHHVMRPKYGRQGYSYDEGTPWDSGEVRTQWRGVIRYWDRYFYLSNFLCSITSEHMQPGTFIEVKVLGTNTGFKGIAIYQNNGPAGSKLVCPVAGIGGPWGFNDINYYQFLDLMPKLYNRE